MYMGRKTQHYQDVSPFHLVYKFNAIQMKTPKSYFVNIDKMILKFLEIQKTQNSENNIVEREEQNWSTDTTQFQDLL